MDINQKKLDNLIVLALEEDLPAGDITTEAIVPASLETSAIFLAKEKGVLAGLQIAVRVLSAVDEEVKLTAAKNDGYQFSPGDILAEISGRANSILKAERTALNFLQRLSGIATMTRAFVEEVKGTGAAILDTRKTTPGWRELEKYAVRVGGGKNHRMSLSDMMLIKDNHIRIAGGITAALEKAKEKVRPGVKIEIEATNLQEVEEALKGGADIIMLDNMKLEAIRQAVEMVSGRVALEVSGKVNIKTVREIALTGVNFISVGALTHSFRSSDISLEFT
ncbi:MAG TPA: carboxylating nicotinate-nucleotide diphosphorylase [Candidatus Saccharicenans sp.]|jgi:nicotinate-nucleotide pyrophosphorylase (carboxylating)|nr:carboxylating nicotinate-nucleotide diphosphorylase [Candidatus Saccharicenans sp.]HPB58710.1 carboxylating nicotinate-nucleotide diphosphorylase [Candidatus Saccharicenans sp.]HQO75940.1 carboxylating nicotinate-nucleotide diphosphorylase [Candidatus Saccharicenans sp.]HUM79157.1 carboxylating nicotinate-nucleotide diphosphorylase [Candidatus Saccharicenans sp.]